MSRKSIMMAATALSVALITPQWAAAQAVNTPEASDEVEEVVVRGIRRGIKASIDIKKSAIGVVDSIAAEDLGKLPDQNVAESLQRIAGVTIERNRGEGSFISVRGFGPKFNAVTVNGRTLATEHKGREFSFDVLPSEIISGADVYKTPQANIVGASIGATVDVRTMRPLDQNTFAAAASIGGVHASLADKTTPKASGVISWRNSDRTLGLAVAASHAEQEARTDEFTIGAGHVKRSSNSTYYNRTVNGTVVPGGRIGPNVAPFTGISMPSNLSPFFYEREKKMTGLNASGQWKPVDNLTLTLDGLYSKAEITDQQTGLAYDFAGGTLVEQVVEGNEAVYQRYEGGFVDQIIQFDRREVTTTMLGLNANWRVSPSLTLTFDASTSKAERRGKEDNNFTTIRRKDVDLWWDRRGGHPIYDYGFTSPNYADAATNPQGITAHYYIWGGGSDVDDEISEYKIDARWTPDSKWSIFAGMGLQERTKTVVAAEMPFGQQCAYCDSNFVLSPSLFQNTNRNFFDSHNGNVLRDWLIYDTTAVIAAVKAQADLDGKAFAPGGAHPAGSSVVDEKVATGYIMGNYSTWIRDMALDLNFGVRVESTTYTSTGASRTILSAKPTGGGQNDIVVSGVVPVGFRGEYSDVLPSFNAKLAVTPEIVLRFGAAKVLTRPTMTDLSPAQSIQTNPGNETLRMGNPDLQPFRANQYEIGAEWYFADTSLLSFAAFHKEIHSFVTTATTPQLVDEITFQVTVPVNGNGATVKGYEILYRQVFSQLPSPWDGLGAQASYTYADSNANYVNAVTGNTHSLEGLSKTSYSLVGFYEKYGVQARMAYTWRDNFLQTAFGRNGEPEYFDAYGQLDASLSYDVTRNFTVFVDGLNLTDEEEFLYSVSEDRTKEFRTTGKRVSFGLRYRY
ncbi:TonB-dependent receptor [Asticcacaulis tiandongensis]|uniref:TonB-dependent receptor n=1 Tax=Asticcacaulis tiandongensis TaxID=2565365 RepID=UPI001FED0CEA|nr:TonB-dependent receptor [Asticcacaulis tiandongensis]